MQYQFVPSLWNSGVFAVPAEIVDRHIRLCGGASLKILVVMLRRGGAPADAASLAAAVGLSLADAADALNYWTEAGVLTCAENPGLPAPDAPPAASARALPVSPVSAAGGAAPPAPAAPSPAPATAARPRYPREELTQIVDGDRVLKGLVHETQAILGKVLTSVDMDVLVGLYSYYNLPAHFIVTLIQYCVSIYKRSMAYIEKTAAAWMEQGVDANTVDAHVERLVRQRTAEAKIASAFGITGRKLVPKEKEMIGRWTGEYGFTLELIAFAYEISVERTGKLVFKYIDSILQSWHKKGIHTLEAAKEDARPAQNAKNGKNTRDYDLDRMNRMILDKLMKE